MSFATKLIKTVLLLLIRPVWMLFPAAGHEKHSLRRELQELWN